MRFPNELSKNATTTQKNAHTKLLKMDLKVYKKFLELEGAIEQEALEVLEVAMEISGGKAIAIARMAFEVMENMKEDDFVSAEY